MRLTLFNILLLGLTVFGFVLDPVHSAQASDLSDFEEARTAYEQSEYEKAMTVLEGMVGGEVPRIRNPALILESRKYLGASYLFLGKREKAAEQFRQMVRADESYEITRARFPTAVYSLFQEVKEQVRRDRLKREEERRERELAEQKATVERLMAQEARLRRLRTLAETEVVEKQNRKWLAFVPFGAGQFQNGDIPFGRGLLVSELTLSIASLTLFFAHQFLRRSIDSGALGPAIGPPISMPDDPPPLLPTEQASFVRAERGLRIANWVVTGALIVVTAVGVIHALMRFKPVLRLERKRKLPDDLERELDAASSPTVTLGPTGMSLSF